MSNRRIAAMCIGLWLPLLGAGHAWSQATSADEQATPGSAPMRVSAAASAALPAPMLLGTRRAVSVATLAAQRGGTEVTDAPTLSGSVSGNTSSHTVSGANSITGGAFANSSGLPVVVQNSGNNVLIQTSTVVNVTIR